ncbi:sugar nucleotide-binding protein [Flavobacterium beibuense]|uniref:sugar nucleotide-binding protein n=1 Tax=Flavobacterium beibuense TaxID=657326 RepID=UPI003A8F70D1
MKVLIFGGSGFIGKNLLSLLNEKHEIFTASLRIGNTVNSVSQADVFINLIGKAHDHSGEVTEDEFYFVNFDLAKKVYHEFVKSEAKLLVHISSIAAVEEYESKHFLKEDDLCNPMTWYGKSKRKAEVWLLNQPVPLGKKIVILRLPMVHGSGDKGNLKLLYKLISKKVPYPLGAFNNYRSFISVDNLAFFIESIIINYKVLEAGVYHVADDESVSTSQIIEIIKKIQNIKLLNLSLPKFMVRFVASLGDIVPIPLNSNRLKKMTSDLVVSNKKIKQALGIKKLPLTAEEGLIKTIQSFKNNK